MFYSKRGKHMRYLPISCPFSLSREWETQGTVLFSSVQLELKDNWCWIHPVSLGRNARREQSTMNPICWAPGTEICRVCWAQGSELWAFPGFLPWSSGALKFTKAMHTHREQFSWFSFSDTDCTKPFIFWILILNYSFLHVFVESI